MLQARLLILSPLLRSNGKLDISTSLKLRLAVPVADRFQRWTGVCAGSKPKGVSFVELPSLIVGGGQGDVVEVRGESCLLVVGSIVFAIGELSIQVCALRIRHSSSNVQIHCRNHEFSIEWI